jgi:hypothetical protein
MPFAAAAEMMPVPKMNVARNAEHDRLRHSHYDRPPEKDSPRNIKPAGLIQECSGVERLCEKEERRLG